MHFLLKLIISFKCLSSFKNICNFRTLNANSTWKPYYRVIRQNLYWFSRGYLNSQSTDLQTDFFLGKLWILATTNITSILSRSRAFMRKLTEKLQSLVSLGMQLRIFFRLEFFFDINVNISTWSFFHIIGTQATVLSRGESF